MTDEQIIKALECCIGNTQCNKCLILGTSNCMNKLMQNALNLINRKKAEIESLKQIIDEQDKEIIKLQKRIIFWREDLNYHPEKIKSEAIKEFAERLCKRRLENDPVVIATKAELDYVLGVGLEVQE